MKQSMVSFLLLLLSLFHLSQSLPDGLRTELIHVDTGSNYTKIEILNRMVQRTRNRGRYLASRYTDPSSNVTVPSFPSSKENIVYQNEYLINISIGMPPQPFVLTLDTGSNLIWTQCEPLIHYFNQTYPFFNPNDSSTFSYTTCESQMCDPNQLPEAICSDSNYCQYNYTYGDGSYTSGVLGTETFTLGTTAVSDIYFGCGNDNTGIYLSNECGIAGFGRGSLSLVSQLGYPKFAYCFTSFGESKSSPVLFGSAADITGYESVKIQSTPFFPSVYSTYYYLTLNGITVGTKLLDIPNSTFAVNSDGSGGVIIDSGTSITIFPEKVFEAVISEFMSQVALPVVDQAIGLLCFNLSSTSSDEFQPPKFVFHFDGADLDLPAENYMYSDEGLACLAVSNSTDPMTVIGNFQQQNIHVLYDLVGEELSFAPAQCDQV